MHLPSSVSAQLKLADAAEAAATRRLDHFPGMIIYGCLAEAAKSLDKVIKAELQADFQATAETLTMPRRGFGPRPVSVLSPSTRVLYGALVSALEPALPAPSRGSDRYEAYQRFGTEGTHSHVVDIDFASCYEFIDHELLFRELLLRSMDQPLSAAVRDLLQQISPRGRGLPQMLSASDLLADTYLSIVDRRLARDGYEVNRYADDIRVRADGWDSANRIIEQTAEYARDLGLILSAQKTQIRKRSTLVEAEERDSAVFTSYYQAARASLTETLIVMTGPYGDIEEQVVEPEEAVAVQAASRRLLDDWRRAQREDPEGDPSASIRRLLGTAILSSVDSSERLPDPLLKDLVFFEPQRLEQVANYISRRARRPERSEERHYQTLRGLTEMGRQSPWAKLALLATIERTPARAGANPTSVMSWVERQLDDRHESVRAQAAWTMSSRKVLTKESLRELWVRGSEISHPALAAAAAKQGDIPKGLMSAVVGASPLTKEAAEWAQA